MIVIHPMSYVYLFRAGGAVKLRGCEPASPRAFPSRPTASDEMRPAEASQRRGEEIRDGILPLRAAVPNRVESPGEMRDGSRYRLTTSTGWAHGCIKRLSLDQKDSGHISPIRPSDGDHGCIKRKKRRFGAGLFPLRCVVSAVDVLREVSDFSALSGHAPSVSEQSILRIFTWFWKLILYTWRFF